jgi:hypothetical protein
MSQTTRPLGLTFKWGIQEMNTLLWHRNAKMVPVRRIIIICSLFCETFSQ